MPCEQSIAVLSRRGNRGVPDQTHGLTSRIPSNPRKTALTLAAMRESGIWWNIATPAPEANCDGEPMNAVTEISDMNAPGFPDAECIRVR